MARPIFFSDLDGTLLDINTYSFSEAMPGLLAIRRRTCPLVLSSSKTRAEMELYRRRLDNHHPFVTENGGGIFIPPGYFSRASLPADIPSSETEGFTLIRLGTAYDDLRRAMGRLRRQGHPVRGFGDMTVEEVARVTGLPLEEAALARHREFDEPFILDGEGRRMAALTTAIAEMGLSHTQGVFHHLKGPSDKGKALEILKRLYQDELGEITTIALGDSLNDLPMLERVDHPVLVQRPGGRHDARVDVPGLLRAPAVGPAGWSWAVTGLLERL